MRVLCGAETHKELHKVPCDVSDRETIITLLSYLVLCLTVVWEG